MNLVLPQQVRGMTECIICYYCDHVRRHYIFYDHVIAPFIAASSFATQSNVLRTGWNHHSTKSGIMSNTVSKLVFKNLAKCSVFSRLCHFLPENGTLSFEELAVPRLGLKWFPFGTSESQIAVGINRIDLFYPLALHTHHIALVEAFQFLIDLILDSPLTFAWQIMIPPPGSTRTKRNLIEVLSVVRDSLAAVIGSNTESICIMRFRQVPGLAQGGCLVAKKRGKGDLCAERGVEIAFALHRPLGHLIQVSTYPLHLERDLAFVELMLTPFTQAQH